MFTEPSIQSVFPPTHQVQPSGRGSAEPPSQVVGRENKAAEEEPTTHRPAVDTEEEVDALAPRFRPRPLHVGVAVLGGRPHILPHRLQDVPLREGLDDEEPAALRVAASFCRVGGWRGLPVEGGAWKVGVISKRTKKTAAGLTENQTES